MLGLWHCVSHSKNTLFSSSDPRPDPLFRHSFWHIPSGSHCLWHILWHFFWHSSGIYSDIASGIYSDILPGILSGRHSFWHSIWYIFGGSLWFRSRREHSDRLELAVAKIGRIRRLKRTVPFTFRRLERGLEGRASSKASSPSPGGFKAAWRRLHLCEAFKGLKGASRGLGRASWASRGLQGEFQGGFKGSFKGASRGLEKGLKGAWRWRLRRELEGGLRRASRGLGEGLKRASPSWSFQGLEGGFRASRGPYGEGFEGGLKGAGESFKGASSQGGLRRGGLQALLTFVPPRWGTLQAPLEGYLRRWWLGSSPCGGGPAGNTAI